MAWLSDQNTNLLVRDTVVLNPLLDKVAVKLEPFFKAANHTAYVTSGVRQPEDQLRIIKHYCEQKKIEDDLIKNEDFAIDHKVLNDGKEIYWWQLGWSKLLNKNVIINPPLAAEVLLDYFNKHGVNRKGHVINPSIHFLGRAIDIGGGANTIHDEEAIVNEAIASGQVPEIIDTVSERENNCLHLNLKEVT